MQALTIMQPFAELIARGEKRVENRTWRTNYRGQILIHAGASRRMMTEHGHQLGDDDDCEYSAIVAVAELVDCLTIREAQQRRLAGDSLEWLANHEHAHGPFCWVLENVRRLETPIPIAGKLSLWNVPETVARDIQRQLGDQQ